MNTQHVAVARERRAGLHDALGLQAGLGLAALGEPASQACMGEGVG
jgi:hypothetical protein